MQERIKELQQANDLLQDQGAVLPFSMMTQSDLQQAEQGLIYSSNVPEVQEQQQQQEMEATLQQQQQQQRGVRGSEEVQRVNGVVGSSSPVKSPQRHQQQQYEIANYEAILHDHHQQQQANAQEPHLQQQHRVHQDEVDVAGGEAKDNLQLPVSIPAAAVPSPERGMHASRQAEALQEFQQQWQQQQQGADVAGVAAAAGAAWDGQSFRVRSAGTSVEEEVVVSKSWQPSEEPTQLQQENFSEVVSPAGSSVGSSNQGVPGMPNPQGGFADGRVGGGSSSSSSRPIPPAGGGGGGWLALFGRSGKQRPAKSSLI